MTTTAANTTAARQTYFAVRLGSTAKWTLSPLKTRDALQALVHAAPDVPPFAPEQVLVTLGAVVADERPESLARYLRPVEVAAVGTSKRDAENMVAILNTQAAAFRGAFNGASVDLVECMRRSAEPMIAKFREEALHIAAELTKAAERTDGIGDAAYALRWRTDTLASKQEAATWAERLLRYADEGEDEMVEAAARLCEDITEALVSGNTYESRSTCPYSNAIAADKAKGAREFLRTFKGIARMATRKAEARARLAEIEAAA